MKKKKYCTIVTAAALALSMGGGFSSFAAQTKGTSEAAQTKKASEAAQTKKASETVQTQESQPETADQENTGEQAAVATASDAQLLSDIKLPAEFQVEGIDTQNMSSRELYAHLQQMQKQLSEKKLDLDINGYQALGTYGDLGAQIINMGEVAAKAAELTGGNLIDRFMKEEDLKKNPLNLTLQVELNEEAYENFINKAMKETGNGAVNATITRENGQFVITPGKEGITVDKEPTKNSILAVALSASQDKITATTTVKKPDVTEDQLAQIKDVLGTFSTNFSSSSAARANNLVVGAAKINGHVLMPGQTLSGYECMHPFTVANGYKIAHAYENGQVVDSVGGGACQIATTLYQAALRAEIQITERKNHSMTVSYVQPSGDATIAGTYKDIKITNNRSYPIYVEGYTSGRNITFTIWGKEDRAPGRTVEFVSEVLSETPMGVTYVDDPSLSAGRQVRESSGHSGRVSKLWKVVKQDGKEVSRELISKDTYRVSNTVIRRGTKPVPTPAPTEAPTAAPSAPTEGDNSPTEAPAPTETQPAETQGPAADVEPGPGSQ